MIIDETIDKNIFKNIFIVNFLATWVANNYEEACMAGNQERLNHPPVEDAIHLAEQAYNEYLKFNDK